MYILYTYYARINSKNNSRLKKKSENNSIFEQVIKADHFGTIVDYKVELIPQNCREPPAEQQDLITSIKQNIILERSIND